MNPVAPARNGWSLRPLVATDRPAVLRLNAANAPAVYPLDDGGFRWLLGFSGDHFVAVNPDGEVLGYLLSFPSASGYDDTEISQLRTRIPEPFLYICQIVIASGHRRQRIAHALYETLAEVAQARGVRVLCCDVNTEPPNPVSFAFHRRRGFAEIGRGTASNGFRIAFLMRRL